MSGSAIMKPLEFFEASDFALPEGAEDKTSELPDLSAAVASPGLKPWLVCSDAHACTVGACRWPLAGMSQLIVPLHGGVVVGAVNLARLAERGLTVEGLKQAFEGDEPVLRDDDISPVLTKGSKVDIWIPFGFAPSVSTMPDDPKKPLCGKYIVFHFTDALLTKPTGEKLRREISQCFGRVFEANKASPWDRVALGMQPWIDTWSGKE